MMLKVWLVGSSGRVVIVLDSGADDDLLIGVGAFTIQTGSKALHIVSEHS